MDKKHRSFLGELGRTPLGFLIVLGALAALTVAVLVPVLSSSGGRSTNTAFAELSPPGCDPSVGTAAASIRIDSAPPFPQDGDTLHYKVGVSYPAIIGLTGCDAFDVDVFFQPPPGLAATPWQFACNFAAVPYGSATAECAGSMDYIVNGADRDGSGDLVAHVHIIGNKHDSVNDCTVAHPRDPTTATNCFDASATSKISQPNTPTPTSTPTNTPTNTPTPTPTNTATPTNTNTPTPTNTATPTNTNTPTPTVTATPTNTATATPTPGLAGCTPGFWKTHPGVWGPTGYSPGQAVGSVFTVPFPVLSNATLLQALAFKGGPTIQDADAILLRAAVAALLNSSHPDVGYPLSPAQIIAQVNAAIATGDRSTILTLASLLDGYNNAGCTIDAFGRIID